MRCRKKLRKIKDKENLDGFLTYDEGNIEAGYELFINVSKLWARAVKHSYPTTYFIKEFTNTFDHEMIHWLIRLALNGDYKDKYEYKEEQIVYSLLGQKWTKNLERLYKPLKEATK